MTTDTQTQTETLTINGITLHEGDTLWRYAALRTWGTGTSFSEQDPDDVLAEIANALAERYPDAVDNQPADVIHADLRANPGIYDDTELIHYHAMEVMEVNTMYGTVVAIKDLREGRTYAFESERTDLYEGGYTTCEPLAALERHLGVTVLPVSGRDDDDEAEQ